MSRIIDDSPVSDNKMDISEPTTATSQESIGITPEIEQKSANLLENSSINSLTKENHLKHIDNKINSMENVCFEDATAVNTSNNCTNINNGKYGDDDGNSFDNRNIRNTISNQTQQGGLTLVNMHPLMPPLILDENDLSPDLPDSLTDREWEPLHQSTMINNFDQCTKLLEHKCNERLTEPTGVSPMDDKTDEMNDIYFSSGESEPDISQYQASVEPSFQIVTLTNFSSNKSQFVPKRGPLRKIPLTPELMSHDDVSSVETFSNNSFDDECDDADLRFEPNKFVKSNTTQSTGNDTGFTEITGDLFLDSENIISNNVDQQRQPMVITLPDGQTRDIDMKVIEPYKRVLSHGGYLKAGGHNAIVIFSACFLPDRSRTDYNYVMENLFLYVIKTLEQFVTEDYVLIYLHGGSTRGTVPPFPWLKKCYQLLDRRIRKSLKNLYMVHPTFWLKSVVWMTRPFISSKFWKKLVYIRTLDELYQMIPVEKAAVPEKVKKYDLKHI